MLFRYPAALFIVLAISTSTAPARAMTYKAKLDPSTAGTIRDELPLDQTQPVTIFRDRLRLTGRESYRHVHSDKSIPLRDRVWAYYDFATTTDNVAPGPIAIESLKLRPSSIERMERALWGRIFRFNEWIGFERGGGPVLFDRTSGFNGVGELHYRVWVQRTDLFEAPAAAIFADPVMKFHFDQHRGSDHPGDVAMDPRRPRRGVEHVDMRLMVPKGPRGYFRLRGFWTRGTTPEDDQVIAIGRRLFKPGRAYRKQLAALGFADSFIDQVPAGARLVFLSRSLERGENEMRGSLMLIFPFRWSEHFGPIALSALNEPSEPARASGRGPIRRPKASTSGGGRSPTRPSSGRRSRPPGTY